MAFKMDVWKIKGISKLRRSFEQFFFAQLKCLLEVAQLIFLWSFQAVQATMAQYLPKVGKDAGLWMNGWDAFFLSSFLFLRSYPQIAIGPRGSYFKSTGGYSKIFDDFAGGRVVVAPASIDFGYHKV